MIREFYTKIPKILIHFYYCLGILIILWLNKQKKYTFLLFLRSLKFFMKYLTSKGKNFEMKFVILIITINSYFLGFQSKNF